MTVHLTEKVILKVLIASKIILTVNFVFINIIQVHFTGISFYNDLLGS